MLKEGYKAVMNTDRNPLRALPKMVRFQYMLILSYMWSIVFTLWVGSSLVFGFTIAGHTILLIGVFFTADVFRRARSQARRHRDGAGDDSDSAVLGKNGWSARGPVPARASNR